MRLHLNTRMNLEIKKYHNFLKKLGYRKSATRVDNYLVADFLRYKYT